MAFRLCSVDLQPKVPRLVHTTYYSNFFLLRTKISINGELTQVGVDERGWLTLNSRDQEISVTFDSLVTDVNDVLQQHGLHGVSNYWCEEVPLFELRGTSQDELEMFLRVEGKIRRQLGQKMQTRMNTILEERESSAHTDFSLDLTVVVEPELYLIIPDQDSKDGKPIQITEENFAECMALFGRSKMFDFGSIFRAARANPRREDTGPEDLAVLHVELHEVVKWYRLGKALEVPENILQEIKQDNPNNTEMCRNAVLTWWFQNGLSVTWLALVNALSNSDMHRLATIIALKYDVPVPAYVMRSSTWSAVDHNRDKTKDNSSQVSRLKNIVTKLKNDIREKDQQLADKSSKLDEAEREKMVISQQMEQLTIEYSESQLQCQRLLKQKEEMESVLKEIEHQQHKQEKEVSDLRAQLQSVEEELQKTNQQIPALEEQLQEKSVELKEKIVEVQCLRENKNSLQEMLNTKLMDLDNNFMLLTAAKISPERYKQELEMQQKWMQETSQKSNREFQGYIEEQDLPQITQFLEPTKPLVRSKTSLGRLKSAEIVSDSVGGSSLQTPHIPPKLGRLNWEQKKRAPSALLRGSAAVQGDTVYVIAENSRKIHKFCLSSNEWSTIVGECPHTNPGIAFVEGVLTAFGGQRLGQQTTKVSSFKDRVWADKKLPRMKYPHSRPSVLNHQNKHIIVTGGACFNEIPMVEVFSIDSWSWSKLVLLPKRFHNITTTVCDNTYLAVDSSGAGYSIDLPSLLTLAKDTKPSWMDMPRLSVAGKPTVAAFRGRIIAVSSDGVHQLTEDHGWAKFDDAFSPFSAWSGSLVCVMGERIREERLVVMGGCNPNSDYTTPDVYVAH